MSINLVFMLGNLTRDPILRRMPSGVALVDMGLAVFENRKSKEGEPVETVTYVDVVAWGRQAETCAEHLQKGSAIFLEGRLQLDEWNDKEGNKRTKIKIRAERVQFLGRTRPQEAGAMREEVQEQD